MKRKLVLPLVICLLLLCGKGYACDCNPGAGACITGTVHNSQGISGIRVYLYKLSRMPQIPYITHTDNEGCYQYDKVAPGLYVVTLRDTACINDAGENFTVVQLQTGDMSVNNDFWCQ